MDVMCLVIGGQRTALLRQNLRIDLASFVLKHTANRALISALRRLDEISHDMGLHELEDAAQSLLAGDGLALCPEDELIAEPGRAPTSEEKAAMRWKCRLEKESDSYVVHVLKLLTEDCIEGIVQEYRDRPSDCLHRAVEEKPVFLLGRDCARSKKHAAAKYFLKFFEDRGDGELRQHLEALQDGKFPRGW